MTRKLGSIVIALATVCIVLADASDAQARRRGGSHGSWGSNGGSHGSNGSHGSWGGRWRRHGSHGSNGSWGGRWRRHGSNGSWGSNGSHGGYTNGCGSNGGSYHSTSEGGTAYYGEGSVHTAQGQTETRYYGPRNGAAVAPAPIHMENEQSSARPEIRESDTQQGVSEQGSDVNTTPPSPPNPDQQGPVNGDNSAQLNEPDSATAPGTDSGAGI
jgi:hypothetical protein